MGTVATYDLGPGIRPAIHHDSGPWFPAPIKAAVRTIDATTAAVRGEQFDAASFARGTYSAGSFVVVDGGEYVLLVLGTS